VALVIGGLFLLGMVVAAGYAARTLPADARVPLNAGVFQEYSVWLSKPVGLAAWLAAGVAAFAVFAALTRSSLAANWAQSLRVVLLPCVMMVVLAAEAGAVIVARRQYAGTLPAPGTVATPASEEAAASNDAMADEEATASEEATAASPSQEAAAAPPDSATAPETASETVSETEATQRDPETEIASAPARDVKPAGGDGAAVG
jgi:hypothetical protein